MVVVDTIALECGHVLENPRCYQAKDPSNVHCKVELTMDRSSCEHDYVTDVAMLEMISLAINHADLLSIVVTSACAHARNVKS